MVEIIKFFFVATLFHAGACGTAWGQTGVSDSNASSNSTNLDGRKDQDPETNQSTRTGEQKDDPRKALVAKLRDEYWKAKDKKGVKRKAEPALFDLHDQMTREWIAQLSEEDFVILEVADPSAEQAKRAKVLLREYNKRSQEIVARLAIARRLAKKIIQAHWESLAQTGVIQSSVPEYAREFESTVNDWFISRSIEDLKIFEKTRPSKSEKERGDKITSELIKKIDEVKKKFEGNMR